MSNPQAYKEAAAKAALEFLTPNMLIGIGTGSTTNCFIEALAAHADMIRGAIPSSIATEKKLQACGIPIASLADGDPSVYIDGADRFNRLGQLIKGGGGAQTREKIIATASPQFICLVDNAKETKDLTTFPLAIEVLPMARSYVGRAIVKLGGSPFYRMGCTTDNGNHILDVEGLDMQHPLALELALDQIPGIVGHGLFARRAADILLIGGPAGVEKFIPMPR